ncbi:MAG TPA: acetyl-CoA synthetase, partial [Ruminococcaceae bacterium]|nr:acetyl-CoA synthetase [Oscillospiraceae bacterium]
IYFSSGTAGMPKMVLHDFTLPLGHILTAKYWQRVQDNKIHMTQTDSGWAKFAWGKIYGQWLSGAAIGAYDTDKFVPDKMLKAIQLIRPATFCAPATIYRYLIKEDLSGINFDFIEHASMAGEPLNPEVFHQIEAKTGMRLHEGFGQTEGPVLLANFGWFPIKPGSMGKPSPMFGLKLLDENGQLCDDGVNGSICVTGTDIKRPTGLFREYYRDEETTKNCWHDGVYNTGDIAWRDDEGYYWFVGRGDDVIKCSGYRIGPFEVESALLEHPCVLECAVTAAPDPMRGQVVKATIVLAKGFTASDALTKELKEHVKKVTAPYKYPRIIEYVEELPKTVSGKIRRNEIRRRDNEK